MFLLLVTNRSSSKTNIPEHDQDRLKNSFAFYTSSFWKKEPKKLSSIKKLKTLSSIKDLPISKVESFLQSNFDLNQICETMLTQNHYIWSFKTTESLYNMIKSWRKALKLWKMFEKIERWGDQDELWSKICLLTQFRTKYLNQSREIQWN